MSDAEKLYSNYFNTQKVRNVLITCSELLSKHTDASVEQKKDFFQNCVVKGEKLIARSVNLNTNQTI
jgi:hypothetical protein